MADCTTRVLQAFAHETPDRTPLFEIFQPCHPVHWPICGRTFATDDALRWDALADGIAWEELLAADVAVTFQRTKFFGLDMVRLGAAPPRPLPRPEKLGRHRWRLNGLEYCLNERTRLVEIANPGEQQADSRRTTEEGLRADIESWNGKPPPPADNPPDALYTQVRALAEAEGLDWVFMGEIGAGTGAAFYPPFMLEWMLTEPDLYRRWLEKQQAYVFPLTRVLVAQGHRVIAMGGDVSCDKGPFISPALYHEYILPVIREHVRIIHEAGGLAVYTSDGNHWAIKDDFFFNSGIDGYKEVDNAAGMTMERLIDAGIDRKVCIIGNIDARHTLCHGTPAEVRAEVIQCLRLGEKSPGGHILHASHSVHEDVKAENYFAMVNAHHEYFGLPALAL